VKISLPEKRKIYIPDLACQNRLCEKENSTVFCCRGKNLLSPLNQA